MAIEIAWQRAIQPPGDVFSEYLKLRQRAEWNFFLDRGGGNRKGFQPNVSAERRAEFIPEQHLMSDRGDSTGLRRAGLSSGTMRDGQARALGVKINMARCCEERAPTGPVCGFVEKLVGAGTGGGAGFFEEQVAGHLPNATI